METNTTGSDDFVAYLRNKNRENNHATNAKETAESIGQGNAGSGQGTPIQPMGRTQESQDPGSSRRKEKEENPLPTINILYQNPRDTEILILSELGQVRFLIRKINSNKHALQMFSETDYHKTKKLLELVNTYFYTYTPKRDKLTSVLLKRLHQAHDPQEILNELQTFDTDGLRFTKVSRFTTKRSVSENIPLPVFLVQLETNCQFQKLQKINRLCHHVISWEKIKRKDNTMQEMPKIRTRSFEL